MAGIKIPKAPKPRRARGVYVPPPVAIQQVSTAQQPPAMVPTLQAATTGPSSVQLANIVTASPRASEREKSFAEQVQGAGAKQMQRTMRGVNYLSAMYALPATAISKGASGLDKFFDGDIGGGLADWFEVAKNSLGIVGAGVEMGSMGLIPASEWVPDSAVTRAYQGEANYNPSVVFEHLARWRTAEDRGVPMEQVKWADVPGKYKTGARIGGFVVDTMLDPATYLSFGTAPAVKAAAKPLGKQAMTVVGKEIGEDVAEQAAKNAAKQVALETGEAGARQFAVHQSKFGSVIVRKGGGALDDVDRQLIRTELNKMGHQGPDALKTLNPLDASFRYGRDAVTDVGKRSGQWANWESTAKQWSSARGKIKNKVAGEWSLDGLMSAAEGGARINIPHISRKMGGKSLVKGMTAHEVGKQMALAVADKPVLAGFAKMTGKITKGASRGEAALRQAFRQGDEALTPIVRDQVMTAARMGRQFERTGEVKFANMAKEAFGELGLEPERWEKMMPYMYARAALGSIVEDDATADALAGALRMINHGRDTNDANMVSQGAEMLAGLAEDSPEVAAFARVGERALAMPNSRVDKWFRSVSDQLDIGLSHIKDDPTLAGSIRSHDELLSQMHDEAGEMLARLGGQNVAKRPYYGFYHMPSEEAFEKMKQAGLGDGEIEGVLRMDRDVIEQLPEAKKQALLDMGIGVPDEKIPGLFQKRGTPLYEELEKDWHKITNATISRYARTIADSKLREMLPNLDAGIFQRISRNAANAIAEPISGQDVAKVTKLLKQLSRLEERATRVVDEAEAVKLAARTEKLQARISDVVVEIANKHGSEKIYNAVRKTLDEQVESLKHITPVERDRIRSELTKQLSTSAEQARRFKTSAVAVEKAGEGVAKAGEKAAGRTARAMQGYEKSQQRYVAKMASSAEGEFRRVSGVVADAVATARKSRDDVRRIVGAIANATESKTAAFAKAERSVNNANKAMDRANAAYRAAYDKIRPLVASGEQIDPATVAKLNKLSEMTEKAAKRAERANNRFVKTVATDTTAATRGIAGNVASEILAGRAMRAVTRATDNAVSAARKAAAKATAAGDRAAANIAKNAERLDAAYAKSVAGVDAARLSEAKAQKARMDGIVSRLTSYWGRVETEVDFEKMMKASERTLRATAHKEGRKPSMAEYIALVDSMVEKFKDQKPEMVAKFLTRWEKRMGGISDAIKMRTYAAESLREDALSYLDAITKKLDPRLTELPETHTWVAAINVAPVQATKDYIVNKNVANFFNDYIAAYRKPYIAPKFARRAMQIFKQAYFLMPGFTLRNGMSDSIAVMQRGTVDNAKYLNEVYRMLRDPDYYKASVASFSDEAIEGRVGKTVTAPVSSRMFQSEHEVAGPLGDLLNPKSRIGNSRIAKKVKRISQGVFSVEDNVTAMAYYKTLRESGYNADDSMAEVLYALKDYSEISKFMQVTKAWAAPFSTWRIQNIAQQWELFKSNPGLYIHLYIDAPNALEDITGTERSEQQRFASTLALPFGATVTPDLPSRDLTTLLGAAMSTEPGIPKQQWLRESTGIFMGPFVGAGEQVLGVDIGRGEKIGPQAKSIANIPFVGDVTVPGRLHHFLTEVLPQGSALSKAGRSGGAITPADIIGLQVMPPGQQERIVKGAHKRQLKEIVETLASPGFEIRPHGEEPEYGGPRGDAVQPRKERQVTPRLQEVRSAPTPKSARRVAGGTKRKGGRALPKPRGGVSKARGRRIRGKQKRIPKASR